VTITLADPREHAVARLLEAHLAFARQVTPPGHVHAMDVAELLGADVTLYALRSDDGVAAIGALRELDSSHGEIKSMHTSEGARGQGLGKAMLEHLLNAALARGYERVSLETGAMPAFEPARRLYETRGFEVCPPFGDYRPVPNSVCMTIILSEEP